MRDGGKVSAMLVGYEAVKAEHELRVQRLKNSKRMAAPEPRGAPIRRKVRRVRWASLDELIPRWRGFRVSRLT